MAETAATVFLARVARYGDRPALRALAAGGAPRDEALSWRAWGEQAMAFAAALVADGHRPGEAVAILAGNRVAWPVADLGILLAGGVSVGLYPTSPAAQLEGIVRDAGAARAVAGTAEQAAKLAEVRRAVPALRTIVRPAPAAGEGEDVAWEAWLERGARALEGGVGEEVRRRVAAARPEDVALLIYTSGSTGEPKGARIPHRYLLESALSIQETLGLDDRDTALSFLPFCHAAERVFGLHTRIVCGMETGLVEDHARVWEAARAFGPTLFGGLPRFYEKAYETLRAEEAAAAGEARERWARTLALGRERSRLRHAGRPVPPALEAEWREAGGPLFGRARALFGGRVRRATSGGAPLPREVSEYLDALGMPVLGGYGLSEHLCVAFNRPGSYALDTVGPPMPGTELRIAEDGEVLVRRSALTFAGYHGRAAESAAAFTPDGEWLLTGDLGETDARGMLRIIGRKKEVIALSGGKKVAPLPIEARLAEHPWIQRAVLFGEGRRFVSALVCLRRAEVEQWAAREGIALGWDALLAHPGVRERVQAAFDQVNAALSNPERVRRWSLLERDLSPEEGELTPTLKVRRAAVAERHRDRLEALYSEAP